MGKVQAYWWTDIPNFGDRLSPILLEHFADVEVVYSPINQAQVVSIGSILEHIPPGWNGIVAGSGKLLEDSKLHLDEATVLGVRGPFSAKGLKDVAIGDPGLLADELVSVYTRDIPLGIVPHWSDTRLAHDYRFQWPGRLVISPWQEPLDVISQIGRCQKIVTSSLHGAVVADAFGIPRRTEIPFRTKYDPAEGGLFKYEDYHASIGMKFKPGEVQQPHHHNIEDRKHEIYDMYRAIADGLLD